MGEELTENHSTKVPRASSVLCNKFKIAFSKYLCLALGLVKAAVVNWKETKQLWRIEIQQQFTNLTSACKFGSFVHHSGSSWIKYTFFFPGWMHAKYGQNSPSKWKNLVVDINRFHPFSCWFCYHPSVGFLIFCCLPLSKTYQNRSPFNLWLWPAAKSPAYWAILQRAGRPVTNIMIHDDKTSITWLLSFSSFYILTCGLTSLSVNLNTIHANVILLLGQNMTWAFSILCFVAPPLPDVGFHASSFKARTRITIGWDMLGFVTFRDHTTNFLDSLGFVS